MIDRNAMEVDGEIEKHIKQEASPGMIPKEEEDDDDEATVGSETKR